MGLRSVMFLSLMEGKAALISTCLPRRAPGIDWIVLRSASSGIPENKGHVHFMFVYRDPFSDLAYDDKVSLSYKLPVRDDV